MWFPGQVDCVSAVEFSFAVCSIVVGIVRDTRGTRPVCYLNTPCSRPQLYAMRYGAVPIAHKTGGLKDTVIDFNPWTQEGTGWTYTSCDAEVRVVYVCMHGGVCMCVEGGGLGWG